MLDETLNKLCEKIDTNNLQVMDDDNLANIIYTLTTWHDTLVCALDTTHGHWQPAYPMSLIDTLRNAGHTDLPSFKQALADMGEHNLARHLLQLLATLDGLRILAFTSAAVNQATEDVPAEHGTDEQQTAERQIAAETSAEQTTVNHQALLFACPRIAQTIARLKNANSNLGKQGQWTVLTLNDYLQTQLV